LLSARESLDWFGKDKIVFSLLYLLQERQLFKQELILTIKVKKTLRNRPLNISSNAFQ